MKVLLVATEFPPGPGGIGTHCYHLASQLAARGWAVKVMAPQNHASPSEVAAFNAEQDFVALTLDRSASPLVDGAHSTRLLQREAKVWSPDLLLASGARAVWLAALVGRLSRLPIIVVGHGAEFGATGWRRYLTRAAFRSADSVVCVSHYTNNRMRECGIRPRRETVIHNGGDAAFFRPIDGDVARAFRRSLALDDAPLLLTVGSVTDRKGQDVVIASLPQILRVAPDTHYVIAGLPVRRERLVELARDLGVEDHVHFLGKVDPETLLAAYNACDVYVMTSRHSPDGDFEGYGIAVVEAALCGKPAVVSRGSGLAEAIVPGETGLLVDEDNPEDTARNVVRLLRDEALRSRMGQQARTRSARAQTWSACVDAYERLMQEILRDRHRDPAGSRAAQRGQGLP